MHDSLFTGHQGHGTNIPNPLAWHLWCQRCQSWLKIYMGSPHTPAGVTQESVEREGWMTNNKTAQGRSEWGLILGAVKNRKGRVKGKQLTESTVGRGRHTVRGKGTIFPVIFKHIYNTLLHMSGGKKTLVGTKRSEGVLLGEDMQREWNFIWMLLYITHPEQCPTTHSGNVNEWESYSEKLCSHVFSAAVPHHICTSV